MAVLDWASAITASTVTHILITEYVGYHAVLNEVRTPSTLDSVIEPRSALGTFLYFSLLGLRGSY